MNKISGKIGGGKWTEKMGGFLFKKGKQIWGASQKSGISYYATQHPFNGLEKKMGKTFGRRLSVQFARAKLMLSPISFFNLDLL